MDETKYIINYLNDDTSNVDKNASIVRNPLKFDKVDVKEESHEESYEINNLKSDNYVNIQENSTFLEHVVNNLYQNIPGKNEITVETQKRTFSTFNIKDENNVVKPYNYIGKNDIDGAKKTLPKYILDIRSGDHGEGVFALRTIPKDIYFGPFNGFGMKQKTENTWIFKDGKFLNLENKREINWMHYINCARRVEDQNLIILQCEGNSYYRTDRKICAGEELLIYHDEDVKLDGESKEYCHPTIQKKINDISFCTFCCLGFSAGLTLVNPKMNCPSVSNEEVTKRGITLCPYCKLYSDKKEYLKFQRNKGICKLPSNIQQDAPRIYPYKCEDSKKGYLKKYNLDNHSSTGKREQLFQCTLCTSKYRESTDLKLHVKLKHTGIPPENYTCRTCNFKTKYKSNLNTHAVTHCKKTFECERCYNQIYNLKSHRCTNKELYDCQTCGRTFRSEHYLKMHIWVHGDVKFDCKVCGKEFKQERELTEHNLLHNNDKSLECVLCLKKFASKESLKRHVDIHMT